ncbi:MAG: hypothetical protein VB045_04875, partial [Synergistaceae bacterium]|nr:hypothetical protein [Synergistaceae bacterium]
SHRVLRGSFRSSAEGASEKKSQNEGREISLPSFLCPSGSMDKRASIILPLSTEPTLHLSPIKIYHHAFVYN